MKTEAFEIEAESLAAARQQAQAKVAVGQAILSEIVLSDGKERTAKGVADSATDALREARDSVPHGAEIVSERQFLPMSRKSIDVEAFDEQAASLSARQMADSTVRVEGVTLRTQGKKGPFGIGKRPNIYQVIVFQPAVSEVTFRLRARIRVELAEIPSSGFCQTCGQPNSPVDTSDGSVHFFCSSTCHNIYAAEKKGTRYHGYHVHIVDAQGEDLVRILGAAKAIADEGISHCWACNAVVRLAESKCASCGVAQEIRL